jgi:hypothetical protein
MRPYSEGGWVGDTPTPNKCHPYLNVPTDTPFVERTFVPELTDDWDPTEGMFA